MPNSTLPDIIDCALTLGDDPLYDAALKIGNTKPHVQKAIARFVEEAYSARTAEDQKKWSAKDWDAWCVNSSSF